MENVTSIVTAMKDATKYPTTAYAWKNQTAATYLVVSDEGADAFWADGKLSEAKNAGTVDLFTKVADGTTKATTEAAMDALDMSYYLNSVQYEDDTGYVHYEWVWEAV